MGRRMNDLAGEQFGCLTARSPERRGGFWYWRCDCECGGTKTVRAGALTSLRGPRSCGCGRKNRRSSMSQKKMTAIFEKRRKKVLRLRDKGMSWAAIARLMGISRQRVQQIGAGTKRFPPKEDATCDATSSTSSPTTETSTT